MIVRVPFPMPRWRDVLKALTPVMRSYGLQKKSISSIEGLVPLPDSNNADDWTPAQWGEATSLDRAYMAGSRMYKDFDLYDWHEGKFNLVRKAIK